MKIIEQGKPSEAKIGKCFRCGCVFEFNNLDLIPDSWFRKKRLKCPNCGEIDFPSTFINLGKIYKQKKEVDNIVNTFRYGK